MRVWAALCLSLCLAACNRPEPAPTAAPEPGATEAQPQVSPTLAKVRARRRLKCGVDQDKPGFAQRDLVGQWRGFDVDFCRAVAAAVLGDARAVSITPLSNRTRFAALQSGAVDLVSGGGAWTFTHDAVLGNAFAGVTYYDGQGFLARRSGGFQTIADLVGLRICVLGGSSAQQVLTEAFHVRGQAYTPVVEDTLGEAVEAYRKRQCDALSDDVSVLTGARSRLNNAADQAILPGFIADEPLGLMTAQGDDRWTDIVGWTLNALILAEEMQVGSGNADSLRRNSDNPAIRRLLGVDGELGRRLGLADDWSFRAIRQVGDYGEIFERNLAPLGLDRGRNALWDASRPGLIHAPPMR